MKLGCVLGFRQELSQRQELLLVCGACENPMLSNKTTLYMQGIRHNNPHHAFVLACRFMGCCPICCQKIGSEVPAWVMSRAQAIWDGAREESKERLPMGTAVGVLTSWDFK